MAKTQNSVKTRSQFFTHLNNQSKTTKRQNLGQAVALPKFKPVISASWATLLPSPEFEIGDKVADLWRDEFDKERREIGVVVGICWHPRRFQWEYLISWIDGDNFDKSVYPCFDGQLIVDIVNVNYKPSKTVGALNLSPVTLLSERLEVQVEWESGKKEAIAFREILPEPLNER